VGLPVSVITIPPFLSPDFGGSYACAFEAGINRYFEGA